MKKMRTYILTLAVATLTALGAKAEVNKPGYINGHLAYKTTVEDVYLGDGQYKHTLIASLYDENDTNVYIYHLRCNNSAGDGGLHVWRGRWTSVDYVDGRANSNWSWTAEYD